MWSSRQGSVSSTWRQCGEGRRRFWVSDDVILQSQHQSTRPNIRYTAGDDDAATATGRMGNGTVRLMQNEV